MTMEVLAAEFPDIFNQFIEIVPDPNKPDQRIYEDEDETVNATNSILLEHDYGKKSMLRDANDNRSMANMNPKVTISSDSFINTTFSTEESLKDSKGVILVQESIGVIQELDKSKHSVGSEDDLDKTVPIHDEIDEILEDLASISPDVNSNQFGSQFEIEKRSWGCSWSEFTTICHHGQSCPFIRKILDLESAGSTNSGQSAYKTLPLSSALVSGAGQNLVVLKQTPKGLVKVQNTADQKQASQVLRSEYERTNGSSVQRWTSSLGSLASVYPPQYKQGPVPPPCDQAMADISNQRKVYRPPTNSVFIKVPRVSPSEAPSTGAGGLGAGAVILCVDCDSKFADNKSLVKHTRNQHQIYQCSQCGESTIGYYRMASHTKRNHSKEPVFYCNCGRNFSEKRGLTKHQNSCTFYNNS